MKKKTKVPKILSIISIIIVLLGIICWFGVESLINKTNGVTLLLSVFSTITLKLLIVLITIGIIVLIWLIYGIIITYQKIKNKEIKRKNFGIIIILSIFIIFILTTLFSLFTTKNNKEYRKNKYDYNIRYQDGVNIYNIYKTHNKIEVYTEQITCIKEPCKTIKTNRKLAFSNNNMEIVNHFIDSFFINHGYNSIQIFRENLDTEQNNILSSIIYNNETLLNDEYNSKTKHYTIITDSKYRTMQNDGGSNWNIYYEINLSNNTIKKYEDHYIGFKGYEYQGKLIYEKNIDNDLKIEINKLLDNLFMKDDINDTNNYSPYTIKTSNNQKNIYNEESIKSLKYILDKIDNMNN